MAWPLSRYQDFVDNTVPAIASAFLHAVQDALIKVYDGTQTLKSLVVDGVGGSAAAPTPGTIVLNTGADKLEASSARLKWTSTTSAANPVFTANIANQILPLNTVKVAARFRLASGSFSQKEGFGWLDTLSLPNSTTCKIDFAQGFDSANYILIATVETSATAAPNLQPTVRGASSLQFSVCDASGAPVSLTAAGPYYINLILLGRVTT